MGLRHCFLAIVMIGTIAHAETEKPDITIGGFFDGYYSFNFNNPKQTAGANATTASNTYRYYDTFHNQFTLSLAEVNFKVKMKELSFVADLDFGPFADLNGTSPTATGTAVDESSKHVGQAVVSYRPAGSGFSFDAGKMYSHLGVETVKSKDNFNYSRSILFSYAIPFWHTGLHVAYDLVPEKFQTSLYLYNGWNNQYDTNRAKTIGAQFKYTPSVATTVIYNFLGGPERPDNETDWKTIHELNLSQTLSSSLLLIGDLVHGSELDTKWYGGLVGLKYLLSDESYFSPRYEMFRDNEGASLGSGPQTIHSVTLTYGRMLAPGFETRFEARGDYSNESVFPMLSGTSKSQNTLLVTGLFSF